MLAWYAMGEQWRGMGKAHALVSVRDSNLICHSYKTSAQIAGAMAFCKSEQQRGTNRCSQLHGSSASMTSACLFNIWLRIFDERTGVFSEEDESRGHSYSPITWATSSPRFQRWWRQPMRPGCCGEAAWCATTTSVIRSCSPRRRRRWMCSRVGVSNWAEGRVGSSQNMSGPASPLRPCFVNRVNFTLFSHYTQEKNKASPIHRE